MNASDENSPSPAVHSAHIRRQLGELIDHLKDDLNKVEDVRFRALLEVSGEMLRGVSNAFTQFDEDHDRARHLAG